jgi:hypothetical protein
MLDETQGSLPRLKVWMILALDLPINVTKQQLIYAGKFMGNQVPGYVKRNGIISFALLVPFILALMANSADKVIYNHTLDKSWLWSGGMLRVWIIWLPTIALFIAAVSFANFVARNSTKTSWIKRLGDIKRAWPVVIPLIGAIFIMFVLVFHDSVQCWVHSPMYTSEHLAQAWHCTNQSRAFNTWSVIKRSYF